MMIAPTSEPREADAPAKTHHAASRRSVAAPSVQFVMCVEAGGMEPMTVWLVQSLRRWGGRFANAPVLAIKPRFGAPLRKRTLRAFDQLDVAFRSVRPAHSFSWFTWMNKPTCLLAAETHSNAETICWLDADILVLDEPAGLQLAPDEQFAACPSDKNVGTSGPEDRFNPYWAELCRQLGVNLEDLPWVTSCRERQPIRFYFNGGLFVYRRSANFAEPFLANCQRLLRARVKSRFDSIMLTEQIALALTAAKLGLRWRSLPWSHNYAVSRQLHAAGLYDPNGIGRACILHHHNAMWPAFYRQFLADLRVLRPEVADWIAPHLPISDGLPLLWKAMSKALLRYRTYRWDAHEARCATF
jgi:hypothetical protein